MPNRKPNDWLISDTLWRVGRKLRTAAKHGHILGNPKGHKPKKPHSAHAGKHSKAHVKGQHAHASKSSTSTSHHGMFQDANGHWMGDPKRYHRAGKHFAGTKNNPQYYTDTSNFMPGYYTTPYGDVTIGNGWNPYASTHVDGLGHVLPGPGSPPPSVWGGLGPNPYGAPSPGAGGSGPMAGSGHHHRTRSGYNPQHMPHASLHGTHHVGTPHAARHPHGHAAKHQRLPGHHGGTTHRRAAAHPGLRHPRFSSHPHAGRHA